MEKSLFFNAMPDPNFETGYDRNYSGDDISDWLRIVCETGVVKEGLAVTAGQGLSLSVASGKATLCGKGYVNTSPLTISTYEDGTPIVAPTGSSPRYDLIVLRLNNAQTKSARWIRTLVFKGTSSIPTLADLTRDSDVYDLLLGYAVIQPNADSIDQIVDTRGDEDLCPWFTAVKGYDDYYDAIVQRFESKVTLSDLASVVVTDIPSRLYLGKYSLVEVFVNGLKERDEGYSVSVSGGYVSITFPTPLDADTDVLVVVSNFIEGEGLETAIAQYTQFIQDVADIKTAQEHIYVCNGVNDNQAISAMANAFIHGAEDGASMTIKVVGHFNCVDEHGNTLTTGGDGSASSPYRVFTIDEDSTTGRRVTLDFTDASMVEASFTASHAVVFHGSGFSVVGLNLLAEADGQGSSMVAFDGDVKARDSKFSVTANDYAWIAVAGSFDDCEGRVEVANGDAYCFYSDGRIVRVNGGTYYAYTGDSGAVSAVVGQDANGAVSILNGVNAPTSASVGLFQTDALWQGGTNNYIVSTALVTALPISVIGAFSTIVGTIPLSK